MKKKYVNNKFENLVEEKSHLGAEVEESDFDAVQKKSSKGKEWATKMKRSSPWADATMISLDDSSDSDSEEVNHCREKRSRSNGSFESFKDIMSEGTLIQTARMYQDYMKRIPIPTFSGSVVTFTSWQGLAESLKHLYKQPLHFLTNILVEQWDGQRFGSDDEHQPLDSVVHPLKAQTLIWLAEELHRLTSSPHHLAKLWASDPMYHSHIDPFLSY